jgi:adenylate cyclase
MRGYWVYFFFLFLFCQMEERVYGQTTNIQKITISPKSQNLKTVDSLFSLGEKYYEVGNSDKALAVFENILPIYQNFRKQQKVGDCYSYIAFITYLKGDYSKALSIFKKSVDAFKKTEDKKGLANALNSIGAVYYSLGNYPNALDFYKQAVVIQEGIGAEKGIAKTTTNIGGIYSKMGDYANAMKYYNKVSTIFKN